jgi:hypothetical protein
MAHPMVKPYSFLLYLLAIIAFLFLGIVYAGITEAGKGQMLAGGAIVLGYGVIGAFIGLCLSLFLAYKVKRQTILKTNGILALIMIASIAYFTIKYQKRQQEREQQKIEQQKPKKTTPPVKEAPQTKPLALLTNANLKTQTDNEMGLGIFKPNFYESKTLYFTETTPRKSIQEHIPTDSITFKQREYGGYAIASAPTWLVPDHLKLDYDMLYFKGKSVGHGFMEVVVNITNNQTVFVDRYAGRLLYCPDFFKLFIV